GVVAASAASPAAMSALSGRISSCLSVAAWQPLRCYTSLPRAPCPPFTAPAAAAGAGVGSCGAASGAVRCAGAGYGDFGAAVGNTPLLRLNGVSALTGCNIFGKAEFANPGGSVKDRAALWIIRDAEQRGLLRPGQPGVIVEGTAGNTGIGLTLVANSR